MKKNNRKIDFVVLWVDPNDKEWQKQRSKYSTKPTDANGVDDREERYRDWGLFRYWFRSVERNAPWVNKVHLVTCGHVPDWLNTEHPKLNVVKHSDIMPEGCLPTFNSNAIELCVHNIRGLSEQFVLFNDDIFITRKTRKTDFFKNGKPVNTMALFALMPNYKNGFHKTVANNLAIINKHFNFSTFKKRNLGKLLSVKQREWIIFTLPLLAYNNFMGFRNYHIAISYLKDTFTEVWEKEPELVMSTVKSRFRDYDTNLSHWLMNYWQFASGNFYQRNAHFGASVAIDNKKTPKYVRNKKFKMICINDVDNVDDIVKLQSAIQTSLDTLFPEKSSYEK